jgi:TetR/AcrR family fatty acid metabolism transcriptional regulator
MKQAQEQAIEAKRQHLLDAAARVFSKQGFHPTTIRDVAKEAGVADGTIYNYFENKTALLFGILNQMRTAAMAQADFDALENASPRDLLAAFFRHPLAAFRHDDFALFRVVLSEVMVNDALRAQYQRDIMEPTLAMGLVTLRQHAGLAQDDPRLDLLVRAMAGMLMGLMVQYVMGDKGLIDGWDMLPDRLADLFAGMLGSQRP